MNLLPIINTTAATDINAETSMLRQRAYDFITSRHVAAHIFSEWINDLPVVATGTYFVTIKDDFGMPTAKEQQWNDALWLITLSLLAEFKALNSFNIRGALQSWSTDAENCMYPLTEDEANELAEWCVHGLQQQGWLELQPHNSVDVIDGTPRQVKKFQQSLTFGLVYENCKADLCDKAHMVCQPLRHKPADWIDNETGIGENANLKLIKGYNKVKVAKHVLQAANMAQSVAYEVHPDMKTLAQMVNDNESDFRVALGYADPAKAAKWEGVFQQWRELALLDIDTPYYFPVTYDFRGRMYYRGGMVSPQASDCCKASFVFRKGYPLGKSGFAAICVALASALGSKESVEVKIQQVKQGINDIVEYSNDFMKFATRFPKSDMCQAWLLARELGRALKFVAEGNKIEDFVSNVPCHQDGTCSGLQHISIITKDYATAKSVNMVPATHTDKPADVYGAVSTQGNTFLNGNYLDRDCTKPLVMLGGYGASEDTLKDKLAVLFNEDILDVVFAQAMAAMAVEAPALQKYTNAIKNRAEAHMSKGHTEITWKTYDGFEVTQQYVDNKANVFHGKLYSAHLGGRFDVLLDSRKMITALSPNLIHSNDSTHLRLCITTSRMDVSLVHDSFGTHACNYFGFNKVLRNTLHEMYVEHDVLADLAQRNDMQPIVFLDKGHTHDMILEAVNCFG